ncbi:hypothetical protein ACRAWF_41460 [Streptomyces sp. L7]
MRPSVPAQALATRTSSSRRRGHYPPHQARPALHPLVVPQTRRLPAPRHGRVIRIGREVREAPSLDIAIEQVLERFSDGVFAFDWFGPPGIRPTGGSC